LAFAEKLAGSGSVFARSMTAKARQLVLRNLRFADDAGLTALGERNDGNRHGEAIDGDPQSLPRRICKLRHAYDPLEIPAHRHLHHLLGRALDVDGIKTG
jgi:D-alanyl-D-alanine carboxypeptidase